MYQERTLILDPEICWLFTWKTPILTLEFYVGIPRNWSNGKKPAEAWFARRSRHANHSDEGTADLDEFDHGLRHDHSRNEQ